MLETVAFYLSFIMALGLFVRGYIEAIHIGNSEGKVYGETFIFCVVFALIFSKLAFVLY